MPISKPLENHVTSLELSRKLKELGVKQESQFYWFIDSYSNMPILGYGGQTHPDTICSAFLSSELGEMIQDRCNEWAQGWNDSGVFRHFAYGNRGSGYMIEGIGRRFIPEEPEEDIAETETNDRTKFLIHLITLK